MSLIDIWRTQVALFTLLVLAIVSPLPAEALESEPKTFHPETFEIEMKVDFGPAGKPTYEGSLEVEVGTTLKDAVSQVFPILSGKICCSFREVLAIDGVAADPAGNTWWTCSVNGSSKEVSSYVTELRPGDVMEWTYKQSSQ